MEPQLNSSHSQPKVVLKSFFKQIFSFNKKNFEPLQVNDSEQIKKEQQLKENQRILEENIKAQIKAQQEFQIEESKQKLDNLFNYVVKEKNKEKIIMILDRGYQINNDQAIALIMCNFSSPIIEETITQRYYNYLQPYFSAEINKFFNQPYTEEPILEASEAIKANTLVSKIIIVWNYVDIKKDLENVDYALIFKEDCKKLKDVFDKYSLYSRGDISKEFNLKLNLLKLLDDVINFIEKKYEYEILEQFSKELDTHALAFNNFDKMKINIVNDVLNNVKNFNETDLPKDANEIIQEIHKIYSETLTTQLCIEQSLELENLYKKRFPQLIEEYIMISPRYREKLKQHNESPDLLLLESLTDIKKGINSLFESIQASHFNELKITNQYLKSKKL